MLLSLMTAAYIFHSSQRNTNQPQPSHPLSHPATSAQAIQLLNSVIMDVDNDGLGHKRYHYVEN
jgi:hypothetical protein